jgi:anti-sigma B factor antagonist
MLPAQLSLSVRRGSDTANVIDIRGQVTAAAESALAETYGRASSTGARTVILNFSGLEYMNSSGIGLLVTLLIRANRQAHRLYAVGLSDHYRDIFELTRLNEAIRIFDSEALAIEAS